MSSHQKTLDEWSRDEVAVSNMAYRFVMSDLVIAAGFRLAGLGIEKQDFAARVGVTPSRVSALLSRRANWTMRTFVRVTKSLGIRANVILEPATEATSGVFVDTRRLSADAVEAFDRGVLAYLAQRPQERASSHRPGKGAHGYVSTLSPYEPRLPGRQAANEEFPECASANGAQAAAG